MWDIKGLNRSDWKCASCHLAGNKLYFIKYCYTYRQIEVYFCKRSNIQCKCSKLWDEHMLNSCLKGNSVYYCPAISNRNLKHFERKLNWKIITLAIGRIQQLSKLFVLKIQNHKILCPNMTCSRRYCSAEWQFRGRSGGLWVHCPNTLVPNSEC